MPATGSFSVGKSARNLIGSYAYQHEFLIWSQAYRRNGCLVQSQAYQREVLSVWVVVQCHQRGLGLGSHSSTARGLVRV